MAGLLAVACLLHVLGGVARAGVVGQNGVWKNTNNLNGGGCSRCDLDQMVKDCPLDVEFMLDMSDSVSGADYERAREYVVRQMRAVVDAFQGTQVGFLAFSNIVHTDIAIRPRSPQELQQLTGLVQTLPQQRYGTQLADALRRARQVLAAHDGTTLVPGGQRGKLIVLVSDGCPDNDQAVKKEAIQAHLDGIAIVSVQLDDAYLDLLKAISIQVLELRTDIDWSSVVACPARFLPPITRIDEVCGDFVIAMDGSDSVRRWEKVMRDYLAYTAMRYSHQTNAMGVVVFGTNVNSQSSDTMIKPTRDKLQLAEQIEKKLSFPNERGTGTTQAIREATAFLRELALTGDPNLSRTLVVITDGPALNPQSARQALANARSEGFQVVVIGVGDTLTAAELQRMAGQQSFVFRVDSYLDLFALDLSEHICGQGLGPCPPGQTRDNITHLCRSLFCPHDQIRDDITGLCKPFFPPCPAGKIRDTIPGRCKCRNHCLPCQIQDPNTCQCRYSLNMRCTSPQVLNQTSCKCECPTTLYCPADKFIDPNTCTCVCIRNCGHSSILNSENCACDVGITLNCGSDFYFDRNTFSCVCLNQCPAGIYHDPVTCACECSNWNTMNCNAPKILNNRTCACECPNQYTVTCGGFENFDPNTCSCSLYVKEPYCDRILDCGPGFYSNAYACTCEPICDVILDCSPGWSFNPNSCTCEPICDVILDCSPGWIFNPSTCTCEPICDRISDCRPGWIFNPNTCTCVPYSLPVPPNPVGPARKCSPSKYRCHNNQPATEDCEGRCICHCDTSLYAGFYCDLPVRPSLCDNCTFTNGHYLAGVEGRCDLFVVCQPTGNGGYLPHIESCPPGTIFKQTGTLGRALCDHPGPRSSGSCPTDPCRRLPAYAKYPNSRNCNYYWQCDANGRTASSGCCPPGQGFDRAQATCAPDSNCPNDCDPNFKPCLPVTSFSINANSCPYKALASDPKKFVNPAAPGLYQSCAPTDIFNENLCRCVKNLNVGCTPYYDINFDDLDQDTNGFHNVEIRSSASLGANGNAGCFGGNSRIILYRFSDSGYNLDYFEVSLRVRLENPNLRPGPEMAVVSNGDCGGEETLAITVDGQDACFRVKSSGGNQVHVVKVPYTATFNGWLDIKFQYERKGTGKFYEMTGTVNGQSESVTLIGAIGHTKCALQLGHGQGYSNLTACVDDFKVWKCKL